MLRLQRLLAFTSRVHTYLLLLLAFFFLAFCAGSYFLVDETYIVLDLLRLACGFGISFVIASVQHLVREGLVIGF